MHAAPTKGATHEQPKQNLPLRRVSGVGAVRFVNLGRRDEGAALIEQAYETYLRELGEDDFSTQRVAEHMRRLGKL